MLEPGYIPAAYKVPAGLLPHQIAAIFAAIPSGAIAGVEFAEFEYGDGSVPEPVSVELVLGTFQALWQADR